MTVKESQVHQAETLFHGMPFDATKTGIPFYDVEDSTLLVKESIGHHQAVNEVLYHGTATAFTKFNMVYLRKGAGGLLEGPGVYLTDKLWAAEYFARDAATGAGGGVGVVLRAKLKPRLKILDLDRDRIEPEVGRSLLEKAGLRPDTIAYTSDRELSNPKVIMDFARYGKNAEFTRRGLMMMWKDIGYDGVRFDEIGSEEFRLAPVKARTTLIFNPANVEFEKLREQQSVPVVRETLVPEKEPWQMTLREYVQKHAPNFKQFLIKHKYEGSGGEKFYEWSDILGHWLIRWSRIKPTYSVYLNNKPISDARTLEDAVNVRSALIHKSMVKQALLAGKPVPPEVLKDYPDIVVGESVHTDIPTNLPTNQPTNQPLVGRWESTTPCWEKYLYQEKAYPKKLDLSGSFTRKRYTGIVNPNVEILDIVTVLARADINYTPEEYPAEQPYIDNRLIPHMRTTKLPFPVIEIYTRDAVDNQRPHLPSGKRPFTDIHIIDGAHRIVALKKIGVKEIPFIVYREPRRGT